MNIYQLTALLCCCIISLQSGGCSRSSADISEIAAPAPINPAETGAPTAEKKLSVRHIDSKEFNDSLRNPRQYEASGFIKAGVIPHHTVGATLISGFFQLAAEKADDYDTVVIVSPNHTGDLGDVVLSRCGWDVNDGLSCDTEIAGELLGLKINGIRIAENDERVEEDHSASVLMPYINYYLPKAKVVPVLVSRTLTLDATMDFAAALSRIINKSEKRVLLVCSIDFSHYLSPAEAAKNDTITIDAINAGDYKKIHDFSNDYIDSPASLIIFLEYISKPDITLQILDNTDASEFLGQGVPDTTSYFVIVGCEN